LLLAWWCLGTSLLAKSDEAKLAVEGMGWVRNRELRFALDRVLKPESSATFDANAIEDGAVILSSALGDEGFQKAQIAIEATLTDGSKKDLVFDPTFANPLPRPLEVRKVKFVLKPGVRWHIEAVAFTGLTATPLKQARRFFRNESTVIGTKRTNAYSPSRLTRASDALLDDLRQHGYAEARVRAEPKINEATGDVVVHIDVQEGPRWQVTEVLYQRDEGDRVELPPVAAWVGQPWNSTLLENVREAIRQAYYRAGRPDVGVHVEAEADDAQNGRKEATVVATIVQGSPVAVGQVRFEGNKVTRESVLRRRVPLKPGDPLDVVALERARYRIARLGVFETVDLRFEPPDGPTRDPIFKVREGPRYETSLLMGYGSYEQVRAGVEHRQMNIFGLAHQSRLEAVQSMKSTNGEYTYTVPELFGESLDGTARLFYLQRREIAFLRQEYGLDASLKRSIARIHGEATAGYTFKAARNRLNALATRETDEKQVNVASVNFGLTGDRRDSPLRPRHGYHWSAELEAADPKLGGEATYQRFEMAGAYHTGWGESRWIHVGLSQGVITTFGAPNDLSVPVNSRFYPGGDNSIRGFQRGEAAPRNAAGEFVGAKVYLLGNLEFEQALTSSWSVVAFGDALATAVSLRNIASAHERLYSVGLGLRYQTLIGPVRVEYGRNVNPRPNDPPGTWHVSIGYPF
jgi:outer membrane protein assembly complex protein YaeT